MMVLSAGSACLGATFLVDSTVDDVDAIPGDAACATSVGTCTLRAAIQEANATAGVDDVVVPAGTYVLAIPGRDEDAGATGDLDVTEDLSVTGAGLGSTVLDAAGLDRFLEVHGAAPLSIAGLTFTRGDLGVFGRTGGAVSNGFITAGTLMAADCAFVGNRGTYGGAVNWYGSATFNRCTFDSNTSDGWGGGIHANGTSLVLTETVFSRNEAVEGGGGVMADTSSVTITACRFDQNVTPGDFGIGGGLHLVFVRTCTIEDSSFTGNRSRTHGGAVMAENAYALTLRRVTVADNISEQMGSGGGLYAPESLDVLVADSTFTGNQAGEFRHGGAMRIGGGTILNSTISGNHAGLQGGAVLTTGPLRILNSTLAYNSTGQGGAAIEGAPGFVEFGGSILVGSGVGTDCDGPIQTLGHNIFASPAPCAITGDTSTDLFGVDPLLGPLQDNGGPTFTHALLAGSPAIDGAADTCVDDLGALLLTDQRGEPRPVDGDGDGLVACDIGALEVGCGADSDGDTLGDACDCAPADPATLRIPAEADVRVARDSATEDAILAWGDLAPLAGSSTLYDVASDTIAALWLRRLADAPCVAMGVLAPYTDSRPVADRGWYYLARGVNACGPPLGEGWGQDSLGVARPACP